VSDQEEKHTSHDPECLPAQFTVVINSIRDRNILRIAEDVCGFLEADSMFALIRKVLGFVPFKLHPCSSMIIAKL
jgi:hypothetical protein